MIELLFFDLRPFVFQGFDRTNVCAVSTLANADYSIEHDQVHFNNVCRTMHLIPLPLRSKHSVHSAKTDRRFNCQFKRKRCGCLAE